MGITPPVQSPFQAPPVHPVKHEQPSRTETNQLDTTHSWDKRRSTPTGPASTPEGQNFIRRIDDLATRAIEGARGVPSRIQAAIATGDPQHIAREFQAGRQALEDSWDQLKGARDLLGAAQATYPDHGGHNKLMADAYQSLNAHGEMVEMGIKMAGAAEAEVGRYAQKIGARLDTIQKINELDALMEQYKHLESVDFTKPEPGQEKHFARMETLRSELVDQRGVPLTWEEGKWNSKGEVEGLKTGLSLARQALFSESQTDQIYLQKFATSSQQHFLLATTFITKYGELLKECIRNILR